MTFDLCGEKPVDSGLGEVSLLQHNAHVCCVPMKQVEILALFLFLFLFSLLVNLFS